MTADTEGFLYPLIDRKKCVNCGLCKEICAFQKGYPGNSVIDAYAMKHRDEEIRMCSRSGGVFTLLSDWILQHKGVIYGAEFRIDFSVHHARADSQYLRNRFRESKYAQSEMEDCFAMVLQDLRNGIPVLFTGTPCQIAGLNQYLKGLRADVSQLYTADIVCHGVPSNKLWTSYLSYALKKHKGKSITKAVFRDKSFGWNTHYESIWIDGRKYSAQDFALLFSNAYIMRPSCYNCKFTNITRPADFTLGDFWGIDDAVPGFHDNKGVSLFLVNTEKGAALFENVRNQAEYHLVDIDQCLTKNPNLCYPTQRPVHRELILNTFNKQGIKTMLVKGRMLDLMRRIGRKVKNYLQK